MNIDFQEVLANLRLLSKLKKNEWLITKRDEKGVMVIADLCENTNYNNFCLALKLDNWECTKEALKNIFCVAVPKLTKDLINEEELKEMKRLKDLLEKSMEGLKHLSDVYEVGAIQSHLETIRIEYANCDYEKLTEFIKECEDSIAD